MTVEEDLKTRIDTQWADGLGKIVYVFIKTPDTSAGLEPVEAATNSVRIVILPSIGNPIRMSYGADLMVYEGEMILSGITHANMATAIAELKEIADNTSGQNGDLSIIAPAIQGEVESNYFVATIRYKWEKITGRG